MQKNTALFRSSEMEKRSSELYSKREKYRSQSEIVEIFPQFLSIETN